MSLGVIGWSPWQADLTHISALIDMELQVLDTQDSIYRRALDAWMVGWMQGVGLISVACHLEHEECKKIEVHRDSPEVVAENLNEFDGELVMVQDWPIVKSTSTLMA